MDRQSKVFCDHHDRYTGPSTGVAGCSEPRTPALLEHAQDNIEAEKELQCEHLQCEIPRSIVLQLLRCGAVHAQQLHCLNAESQRLLSACVLASCDPRATYTVTALPRKIRAR